MAFAVEDVQRACRECAHKKAILTFDKSSHEFCRWQRRLSHTTNWFWQEFMERYFTVCVCPYPKQISCTCGSFSQSLYQPRKRTTWRVIMIFINNYCEVMKTVTSRNIPRPGIYIRPQLYDTTFTRPSLAL